MATDPPLTRHLTTLPSVHIYAIPPLTSTRGFHASPWTAPPKPTAQQIFTARLEIVETSTSNNITVSINLTDPKSGELFASAPYTSPAAVQSALDSSRFFAVRVVGEGGMKATLGLGFEERSDAFDFGVALGEARKVLGWEKQGQAGVKEEEVKRDFSLKKGEKIHVQVGGKGKRSAGTEAGRQGEDGQALFSIAPPPPPAGGKQSEDFPSIAPPPQSGSAKNGKTAQELGFDDGEFGEFQ